MKDFDPLSVLAAKQILYLDKNPRYRVRKNFENIKGQVEWSLITFLRRDWSERSNTQMKVLNTLGILREK